MIRSSKTHHFDALATVSGHRAPGGERPCRLLPVRGRERDAPVRYGHRTRPDWQPLGPGAAAAWLAADLLGASQPTLDWCAEVNRGEYSERIAGFLADHPFRDGGRWASPVFSSYVANLMLDAVDSAALTAVGAESGLLFEFAATDGGSKKILDEHQFAALHTSLLAGQWASSTSVVSVRDGGLGENAVAESVDAAFVLSQRESAGMSIAATVLLERPGRLQLVSPLANLDVEFGGEIIVGARGASIDLGPDVSLRADSIELSGPSMQVSRDTSPSDSGAATVELEVASSFQSDATLDKSLDSSDFHLIVPPSVKLHYPWVQYRVAPDGEASGDSPDERARRLLNKLMNLARRHGHGGLRAVFIKKLEGRQGLSAADFQSAVDILIQEGAAFRDGQLLFIDAEWDRFRYDGKARPGMTSYDDVKDQWDPILVAISNALR